MYRAAVALLIYLLLPFRAASEPRNVSTMTVIPDRQGCDVSPEVGFFYLGADGMLGFSQHSCEAAFQDWRNNYPPKLRMEWV